MPKSIYIGKQDDINRAYTMLRDRLALDSVKDWKKKLLSTRDLKKIHKFLYERRKIV